MLKNSPMPKGDNGWWLHPDANHVNDDYYGLTGGGDYANYECSNCNLHFRVELAD
jgi:hypothetical protein